MESPPTESPGTASAAVASQEDKRSTDSQAANGKPDVASAEPTAHQSDDDTPNVDLAAITEDFERSVLQSLERITSGVENVLPDTPSMSPAQSPQPIRKGLAGTASLSGTSPLSSTSSPLMIVSNGDGARAPHSLASSPPSADGLKKPRKLEAVKELVRKERMRIRRIIAENKEVIVAKQKQLAVRQEKVVAEFSRKTKEWEERISEPVFVRFIDKLCFFVCIVSLAITEAILLRNPTMMHKWYTLLIVPLLLIRYYSYHRQKWHFFILDFCYFTQALLVFYLFIYPSSAMLFAAVFVHSNGPVGWSVITWRNSLVFHDVDRVTSFYIHGFPALVTYCLRWYPDSLGFTTCRSQSCDASMFDFVWAPLAIYMLWQASYYLKTEHVDGKRLAMDDALKTSFKWLSATPSHPSYKIMSKFDRKHWNLVFMGVQLLYTLLTLLPAILFFKFYWAHTIFLATIWCVALWNGANYYVDYLQARARRRSQSAVASATTTSLQQTTSSVVANATPAAVASPTAPPAQSN